MVIGTVEVFVVYSFGHWKVLFFDQVYIWLISLTSLASGAFAKDYEGPDQGVELYRNSQRAHRDDGGHKSWKRYPSQAAQRVYPAIFTEMGNYPFLSPILLLGCSCSCYGIHKSNETWDSNSYCPVDIWLTFDKVQLYHCPIRVILDRELRCSPEFWSLLPIFSSWTFRLPIASYPRRHTPLDRCCCIYVHPKMPKHYGNYPVG